MKTLIAYFSSKGNNYVNGTIRSLSVGNTKAAAEMIAKLTCGDQFEIEPAIPYSEDYDECTRQAPVQNSDGSWIVLQSMM